MSTSSLPLWGQAWELVVTYATATGAQQTTITASAWQPEALHMTFEVLQSTLPSPWWFADISIYNFNKAEAKNTLVNATWATLKAGFQTGPNLYSIIWDGPVFQVLFDQENVVDQRVTLHCVANPQQLTQIVSFATGPWAAQQQIVARMIDAAGAPPIDPARGTQGQQANQIMSAKQYPRGYGCFGKVGKYLAELASDNFITTFQDGQQAYLTEMYNDNLEPDVIYAPPPAPGPQAPSLSPGTTASIIGTPRQTLYGVMFTVLLDPRLKVKLPIQVVALDPSTVFQQLPLLPNPNSGFPSPLTSDLKLFVAQVRHTGDTRGNDWQTEVTGYTTTYAAGLIEGIFAPGAGAP